MKTIKAMALAACVGLASLATAGSAHADGVTIEGIKKAGVLRVGSWLQYEPEMWKDLKTGEIKGFWMDMARKMAKDLGVEVQFIDSDWDGLIPGLQSGKFDIVLAQMAITSKRALAVDFAKPWEAVGLSAVLPGEFDLRHDRLPEQPRQDHLDRGRLRGSGGQEGHIPRRQGDREQIPQ